jgi:hypothetical protein
MHVLVVKYRHFNINKINTVVLCPQQRTLRHFKNTSLPSLSCDDNSGCLLELLLALQERGKSFRAEERTNEESISFSCRRDDVLLLVLVENDKRIIFIHYVTHI